MGYFILAANISLWIGMLGTVASFGDNSDMPSWTAFWIAVAINVATIVRLWLEKRKYKGVKFSTSQLGYFISIACIAIGVLHFTLNGRDSSLFMLIPLFGGVFVAIFATLIIGVQYLGVRNQKGEYKGKEHIFKPADYDRGKVAFAALRKFLIGMGATAIVVAVILFLVGGVDSIDSGDWSTMRCNTCNGNGQTFSGKTCPTCDGFGLILFQEDGPNILASPALWIGGIGIVMIVIGTRLKGDPSTEETKEDNSKKATEIWYCPNCLTPNSVLLRERCQKCGHPKQ